MHDEWLERWESGRTGWHEEEGNAGLKKHWLAGAGSVLVPLCGKTPDLVWLARRGHEVTGVELAERAIREFFAEQDLQYTVEERGPLTHFRCRVLPINIYCGDYFQFSARPFAALYDRGALVAVQPSLRARYVEHTRRLLQPTAAKLIVTLEYDQAVVQGPPFSLAADEVRRYWPDVEPVANRDDIANCPPKFRAAGLAECREIIWRSKAPADAALAG